MGGYELWIAVAVMVDIVKVDGKMSPNHQTQVKINKRVEVFDS